MRSSVSTHIVEQRYAGPEEQIQWGREFALKRYLPVMDKIELSAAGLKKGNLWDGKVAGVRSWKGNHRGEREPGGEGGGREGHRRDYEDIGGIMGYLSVASRTERSESEFSNYRKSFRVSIVPGRHRQGDADSIGSSAQK